MDGIYMAMVDLSILLKLICLVRMTMREVHTRVKIESDLSDSFDCKTGLRQGDSLETQHSVDESRVLFTMALSKDFVSCCFEFHIACT